MTRQQSTRVVCLAHAAFLAFAAFVHAEGFLHTRGHDMVDETGRTVLLRGVGLGNYLLPEGYMWKFGDAGDRPRKIEAIVNDLIGQEDADHFWMEYRENYITEADISRIAELGFNSVRPALNARRFLTEGDDPAYVDEGFRLLDNLVRWCGKHNVYVVIDMHAAPGGQTGANIDDSANDQPELFMGAKYEKRLIDLWVKIAERYKDEPIVAAYDLLNEPLPKRTGAAAKYKQRLEPLYRRITAAIRKVDSKHMIILEGADWSNDWSVFSKPFAPNLVYQFHYYCWDNPLTLRDINTYLDSRKKWNVPVWVGETGESNNTIYWATTQYFESNNIGWSFWPWKKMDATNGPYSIKKPAEWDAIVTYSRGQGKPSKEIARKAFNELLQNIRIENCPYNAAVVNALFHRLPVRVEAENFGNAGPGTSYSVKEPSRNSPNYRKSEPVTIEISEGGGNGRRESRQSIRLTADEWTSYSVNSPVARPCSVVIRAQATSLPAAFTFSFNDQKEEVALNDSTWTNVKAKPVSAVQGVNRMELRVTSGTILFDWADIE
jgi:endoglucanase